MKIESLRIGQSVRHPLYGLGTVCALNERIADVQFAEGRRSLDPVVAELQPAESIAAVTGLEVPLPQLVRETVEATVQCLGFERPDSVVGQLGSRWHGGRLVLHPADPTLQTKDVPIEVFFHKVVMLRNQLRVLEQKINAHEKLTDGEKVEFQQYVSRCYGSLTTFNLLFKEKEDAF